MISSSETIGEFLSLNAEQSRCRQHDKLRYVASRSISQPRGRNFLVLMGQRLDKYSCEFGTNIGESKGARSPLSVQFL